MDSKKLDSVKYDIAWNILNLRQARKFTQEQFAKKSGIPRSTIAYIESGEGNPSLENLLKASEALGVSLNELLVPPLKPFKFYSANSLVTQKRNQAIIIKLLPDPIPNMEVDRIEIEPNGRMIGAPHIPGSREYFHCIEGHIQIITEFTLDSCKAGDLVAFAGDQKHTYVNLGSKKAMGISVVILTK